MSEKFEASYEIEDGYAGRSRPQSFCIDPQDIMEDMDEEDLREMYRDMVQEDFQQKIAPFGTNEDEFVEWALSQMEDE